MTFRKLQAEMDKVFKKVDEGLFTFEETWDKIYSSPNVTNKEKLEENLKKEIKKLQRQREQIKTWQSDQSIKDKSKLAEYRKLIEQKMESFKSCERDAKTKAFSTVGLMRNKVDPKKKAIDDANSWIVNAIETINKLSEKAEAELEALKPLRKKKRKEDSVGAAVREKIAKYEYHVEMLERVLRALHNCDVSPEQVALLREGVDYYISDHEDPDFYEDTEIYAGLSLDAVPDITPVRKLGKKIHDPDSTLSHSEKKASSRQLLSSPGKNAPVTVVSDIPRNVDEKPIEGKSPARQPLAGVLTSPRRAPTSPSAGATEPTAANGPLLSIIVKGHGDSSLVLRTKNHDCAPKPTNAAMETGSPKRFILSPLSPSTLQATSFLNEKSSPVRITNTGDCSLKNASSNSEEESAPRSADDIQKGPVVKSLAQVVSEVKLPPGLKPGKEFRLDKQSSSEFPKLQKAESVRASEETPQKQGFDGIPFASREFPHTHFQMPNFSKDRVASDLAELDTSLKVMEEAQHPEDIELCSVPENDRKSKQREPAVLIPQPVGVPKCFPSVVPHAFTKIPNFEKANVDVLFFTFYYQQGTLEQFLAARELKNRKWRYHMKYMTWFQRLGEPRRKTKEHETGTYIYFDYANVSIDGRESGWCHRIKNEFSFEYSYLEKELV